MEEFKKWCKMKYDVGWICLFWLKDYGGCGVLFIEGVIWCQEEGVYGVFNGFFGIGEGMCGLMVVVFVSDEYKQVLLLKFVSGEEIWCQFFLELVGGFDLVGLWMKVEKDGDEWVINGQKIWMLGVYYFDWGLLIIWIDLSVFKYKGLMMFFLWMDMFGVEIWFIKQVNGQLGFNEVFFLDVWIFDFQCLGVVGDGWKVFFVIFMNEWFFIGGGMLIGFLEMFEFVCIFDGVDGLVIKDGVVWMKLVEWYCKLSGFKYMVVWFMMVLFKGQILGFEVFIGKLVVGNMM